MAEDSGKNTITLSLSHVKSTYWPICGLLVTTVYVAPKFCGQTFLWFCELHKNHRNACHQNFLIALISTGLDSFKIIK